GRPGQLELCDVFELQRAGAELRQIVGGVDEREIVPARRLRLEHVRRRDHARLEEAGVDALIFVGGKDVQPDVDPISGRVDDHARCAAARPTAADGFFAGRTSLDTGWSASASTSSIDETRWTTRSFRSSGVRSSFTFLAFCLGRITSRMPSRRAASTFSLTPPIGRTRPDSVISPVMARSPRTGRPVSSDAIAVAIVTPADGPSFGFAPDGTWTCISALVKKSGSMLYSRACVRSHDSAARADSFITSPSWPVRVSEPPPAIFDASMKSTSPPAGVPARPIATPR